MKNIYSETREDLETYFLSMGEKKFKAVQVLEWLYQKREPNLENWSNIKKELREKIAHDFAFTMPKIIKREQDELTEKYLIELADNEHIEAVLMRHDYGNSVCVSSQVGCNMGCAFCESGRLKKIRNLETYEMVCQILLIEKLIEERISSIVIMGIGEPLDNYENVIRFIKIINDAKAIAIGARHITLSTCGLIPQIKQLMTLPLQINLAISLHASNNDLRSQLMQVNKAYNLDILIDTIKEYIDKTNRRVTIEYVMLNNVNDGIKNAEELARLLRGLNVYVNLIPYNETNHLEFKKSNHSQIMKFYDTLKKNKINVTIRKEFGSKISAACGQLRSKEVN
ncbi:MAG: 23S rRNA (adenine(2503)-C(2))-methyltransferase RlmN [Bacilli bacterium]|jgi:23S rRNA (adenine2503-C2)-methyltransferase|nr:23S rRNA (adenine(2503)-C(2))-methyltransferase RlmN [Bacilli bacterium]